MQIVIDIPESFYQEINGLQSGADLKIYQSIALIDCIKNGTSLEKIRTKIEPKCDRINSLASVLTYTAHREIQELLCDIMDLCKAESER